MVDPEDAAVYYIASADQPDQQDSLDVDELVLADYVSSHSYLDSILTTINLDEVNQNVEFPEYGKRLMGTRDHVGRTLVRRRTHNPAHTPPAPRQSYPISFSVSLTCRRLKNGRKR